MPQKLRKIFYRNIISIVSFIARKEVENITNMILFLYFCVNREVEKWNSFKNIFYLLNRYNAFQKSF